MAQITKDMTFGELLSKYYSTCPKLVDDLMEAGMGCIGCPHSQMESIDHYYKKLHHISIFQILFY